MKRKIMKGLASALALCLAFSMAMPVGAKDLSLTPQTRAAIELCEESGGTVLFEGGSNESYESSDASWLMNAKDDEVITVVYTCTDETHAGWGVLGWGATVNDVWTDGPALSASETNATDEMVATVTVAEFKKALKITDGAVVSFIKLGAWNGGKIISLTISSADAAPKVEGAQEIVIEAPKDLNPEEYLHIFDATGDWTIWPADYLQYWNPGTTIHMTIELEGNGPFSGGIGTCVNNWAWEQHTFEANADNTCTVKLFITPLMDNFYFGIWWIGGTQVGVKSITVEKAICYTPQTESSEDDNVVATPADVVSFVPGESVTLTTSDYWVDKAFSVSELFGNVDPTTVSTISFASTTNFQVGFNNVSGTWSEYKDASSYTINVADIDFEADKYYFMVGLSKNDGVAYTVNWAFDEEAQPPVSEPNDDTNNDNNGDSDDDSNSTSGVIYSGSYSAGSDWNGSLLIDGAKFTGLNFDGTKKLVITYSAPDNSWGGKETPYVKFAKNNPYEEISGAEGNWLAPKGTGVKEVVLTSAWSDIVSKGLLIQGINWTITEVKVEDVIATTTSSMYNGSCEFGAGDNWTGSLEIAKEKFSDLAFDGTETLVITYKALDTSKWGSQIQIATIENYTQYVACSNLAITENNAVTECVLTADMAGFAQNGLKMDGWNLIVSDVSIKK